MKPMPTAAGAAPGRRQPRPDPAGSLLLEYHGPEEGWAVTDEQGHKLNARILTAPALAYYLRREKVAARVSNLDELGTMQLQQLALSKK